MSDERDALAETARNRGLKLVRSRVRTPGKGDFGKVGLTDAAGKPMFGMDGKRLTASPAEVETYLRGLLASDWNASLGAEQPPRAKARRTTTPEAVADVPTVSRPKRQPKPRPEPKLEVRDARPADAAALVPLITLLGHPTDEAGVRARLKALAKADDALLVATVDKTVVGLCGIHRMIVVHRPAPVGRITILVVVDAAREKGVGRSLVGKAETRLRAAGCGLIEVTSNDRLTHAHAFYRHLGYERTSMRFVKALGSERP